MRKSILIISVLSAWSMAVIFSQIKSMTGLEIDVLLYAAIVTIIVGLCKGLYKKNKNQTKEEALTRASSFYSNAVTLYTFAK